MLKKEFKDWISLGIALVNMINSGSLSSENIEEIRKKNEDFKILVNAIVSSLKEDLEEKLKENNDRFKGIINEKVRPLQEQLNKIGNQFAEFMKDNYSNVRFKAPKFSIPLPKVNIGAMDDFMYSHSRYVPKSGVLNLLKRIPGWIFGKPWGREEITEYTFDGQKAKKQFERSINECLKGIKDGLLTYVEEDLTEEIRKVCSSLENQLGDKLRAIASALTDTQIPNKEKIEEAKKIHKLCLQP